VVSQIVNEVSTAEINKSISGSLLHVKSDAVITYDDASRSLQLIYQANIGSQQVMYCGTTVGEISVVEKLRESYLPRRLGN